MCAYTPATGDIFCFPKAADPDDHKHFILAIDGDDALIANFSSFGDEKDPTVKVTQGTFSFITHESCIAFAYCGITPVRQLIDLVADGGRILPEKLSRTQIATYRKGILQSPETAPYVKTWCRSRKI